MGQIAIPQRFSHCIGQCRHCHAVCLSMATGHCLRKGGRHAEPEHLKTMLVCAEICRVAGDVMLMDSSLHRQVCALCADVCDACMASCADLDDMHDCIEACRQCKESCEAMTSV